MCFGAIIYLCDFLYPKYFPSMWIFLSLLCYLKFYQLCDLLGSPTFLVYFLIGKRNSIYFPSSKLDSGNIWLIQNLSKFEAWNSSESVTPHSGEARTEQQMGRETQEKIATTAPSPLLVPEAHPATPGFVGQSGSTSTVSMTSCFRNKLRLTN